MSINNYNYESIIDFESLVNFFADELYWNLPKFTNFDDAVYNYSQADLQLDDDEFSKFNDIFQLRTGDPERAVFLIDFKSYKLPITELRKVLRRLTPSIRKARADIPQWNHEQIYFFTIQGETNHKIINIAHFLGDKPERAKITSFCWELGKTPGRTVLDFCLPNLNWKNDWNNAFDVEAVTKVFFKQFKAEFDFAVTQITGFTDELKLRYFTQKLFNRLFFIAFIEKKGWLKIKNNTDYLYSLWCDYLDSKTVNSNFYNDRLVPLFFIGLRTEQGYELQKINDFWVKDIIGEVQYLNGGLFSEELDDHFDGLVVDDDIFERLFNNNSDNKGLFRKWNFTIEESSPLDVQVALDPEMLGKVFEKLIIEKERKKKGSFYTPKFIVEYMCKEAIIKFLGESYRELVYKENAANIPVVEAKQLIQKLESVKIVDPACGSGAYIVGMLHVLYKLLHALDTRANDNDYKSIYDLKLKVIRDNLYGVDIDEFAVNIAKLRLWLSLSVDFIGDKPKPLPNLECKIETGNALTANLIQTKGQMQTFEVYINELVTAKNELITANANQKKHLLSEILSLEDSITLFLPAIKQTQNDAFNWQLKFIEVFTKDGQFSSSLGFDIVIANPPYVRADEESKENVEQRSAIKKMKYATLWEKWDLYVAFIEQGFKLLKNGGILEFIIPNAYMASKYAQKSHDYFIDNGLISRINFCSELKIFDAAVKNIIIELIKSTNRKHIPTRINHLGSWENKVILESSEQAIMARNTFKLASNNHLVINLDNTLTWGEICYVSKGMVLNSDEKVYKGEFVKADLLSDVKDETHPKSYIEAKWFEKYCLRDIKYLEWFTDRIPHKLSRKTFPELYQPEKIIKGRMTGAIYDNQGLLCNDSCFVSVLWKDMSNVYNRSITGSISKDFRIDKTDMFRQSLNYKSEQFNLKYLLALLNSRLGYHFLDKVRRSQIGFYPDDLKKLPVKKISKSEQQPFVDLVNQILAISKDEDYLQNKAKQAQVHALERDIDQLVYILYDLTPEEIAIVEGK